MVTLDDLVEVLGELEDGASATKATSLRLPEAVHTAVSIAADLGMAESFTAATTDALLGQVRAFVRQRALAEHLVCHPQDQPPLEAVVRRRVSGTDHPAVSRERVATEVARWYEQRHPDWAVSGRVDEAVDRVLEHVELLAALSAVPSRRASA